MPELYTDGFATYADLLKYTPSKNAETDGLTVSAFVYYCGIDLSKIQFT